MSNMNKEGLTWSEWYAAATLGKPCCTPNAWGGCNTRCPRVYKVFATPEQRAGWARGDDPSEYVNRQVAEENECHPALSRGTAEYDAVEAQKFADSKPRTYLGNYAVVKERAVLLECKACNVTWDGCAAACECPKCGQATDVWDK